MAHFDMEQELVLSKNEQIYRHCLFQALRGRDPARLLPDPEQLPALYEDFCRLTRGQPLDLDTRMRRSAMLGESSFFISPNCFAYTGEHDVLLERHDRYFPVKYHSHGYLELMCLVHGNCSHFIGGQLGALRAGDIVCIPPGTSHSFTSFRDDCIIYNLSIRLDDFEARFYNLLKQETALSGFLVKTLYTDQRDAWMIFHSGDYLLSENMLAAIWALQSAGGPLTAPMLNALTEFFLLELLQVCQDRIETHLSPSESTVIDQKILSYIRLRFRTVTLAELSEVFSYSERHISRIVHQATGGTLGAYLQQLRLDYIAQLLADPQLSIAAVFDQAGVRNRSYFYRIFRNHFGVTPAQYRAAHRQSAGGSE